MGYVLRLDLDRKHSTKNFPDKFSSHRYLILSALFGLMRENERKEKKCKGKERKGKGNGILFVVWYGEKLRKKI